MLESGAEGLREDFVKGERLTAEPAAPEHSLRNGSRCSKEKIKETSRAIS